MNLFRLGPGDRIERASEPIEAEFAFPDWVFALSNYASPATARSSRSDGAAATTGSIDRADGTARLIDLPFTEMSYVATDGERSSSGGRAGSAVGGRRARPRERRDDGAAASTALHTDPADVSGCEPIEFPTDGDRTAFGFL
jgi:hypothetical protein